MGNMPRCCCADHVTMEPRESLLTVPGATQEEKGGRLMGKDGGYDVRTETEQLQETVSAFVRSASRGRPVQLLRQLSDPPWLERVDGQLRLSKDLHQMFLTSSDEETDFSFAVTDIRDVYTVEDDGEEAFPKTMVESLNEGELRCIVRVYYRASSGQTLSFCLLEGSPAMRTHFLQSMRVLFTRAEKLAEQSAQPQTG
mmetsp:Transcript_42059/g.122012  ORF Transcript_42059/g.122012 Transcript_42059/m.122012 type:complete len:198 (-) Transcript_42059:76-669(-)